MFWVSLKKKALRFCHWLFETRGYSYSHLDSSLLHLFVKCPVVVSVIDSYFSYLMPSCGGQTGAKHFETIHSYGLDSGDYFVSRIEKELAISHGA
jgi:hypothetical protein